MHAHPFIILCGADANGKPVATHIPVLIETRGEKLFLLAHVMRKQEHTLSFQQNQKVLAIFHGPHTYVAPVGTKTNRLPVPGITRQFT